MGSKGTELAMVLVLAMMVFHGAKAQSGCTSVLMNLSPCLNYVTGNSSTPSSSCCSQLASIVQSQPQCLCALLNGGGSGSSLGININQTLALSLPGACNVQTPPVSRCNAASPVSPPADTSDDTPQTQTPTTNTTSTPTFPKGSGSKTVPATSDASITAKGSMKLHITLFVIFVASKCHQIEWWNLICFKGT
ncbi:Non-specific lipid transfer protein GPI-anchored 5 [Euphorbia peplus]|nr:Non-specific lipid transfer protein GPI-anchored 5 [Euphorbia peplus]